MSNEYCEYCIEDNEINYEYVYATIDTVNNNLCYSNYNVIENINYNDNDNYNNIREWIFSCSCTYYSVSDQYKYIPNYNLYNHRWKTEFQIKNDIKIKNSTDICNHIKTCYSAKIIYDYIKLCKKNIPYDNMKYFTKNYINEVNDIMQSLSPLMLYKCNPKIRHSINRHKYIIPKYYNVKNINNIWKCNCPFNNCIHIVKAKYREKMLLNRRLMCINLAFNYIKNNIKENNEENNEENNKNLILNT